MSDHTDIEDALEFLAGYHKKNVGSPAPRLSHYDQSTINNLASKSLCHKAFSVKQGKLALIFIRKYRNQLRRGGIDIDSILIQKTFRITPLQAMASILCFESEEDNLLISLSFPYDIRIIKMIHDRNNIVLNNRRFSWDGHDKKWHSDLFIDNFEFAYNIAKDNQFYIEPIVEQYMFKIKNYRNLIHKPSVKIQDGKLIFKNLFDTQRIYLEKILTRR